MRVRLEPSGECKIVWSCHASEEFFLFKNVPVSNRHVSKSLPLKARCTKVKYQGNDSVDETGENQCCPSQKLCKTLSLSEDETDEPRCKNAPKIRHSFATDSSDVKVVTSGDTENGNARCNDQYTEQVGTYSSQDEFLLHHPS